MKILEHQSRVFGFPMPTLLLYGGLGFLGYTLFKGSKDGISSGIANIFKSDTEIIQEQNLRKALDVLQKNPAVQSQVNNGSKLKADMLHEAMAGFGTDEKAIIDIFKDITGPNQMAAIFASYGKRALGFMYQTFFSTSEGDLVTNLRSELSLTDLNEVHVTRGAKWSINGKLKWLETYK